MTTTSATRQRTTSASNPFAPGATIAGKQVERWYPRPTAAPGAQHLDRPLRWRKPRHGILTNDLFDGSLSNEAIAAVFGVMAACPQHTFQILTKRPERMRQWFDWVASKCLGANPHAARWCAKIAHNKRPDVSVERALVEVWDGRSVPPWPLPNVWLGVSVENQATADERIPLLLQTPAALRFVSYEPALGPVDFDEERDWLTPQLIMPDGSASATSAGSPKHPGLDWLIVGGESGPGARLCDLAWIRSAVAQCKAARVPAFVKQLGARPFAYGTHTRDGLRSLRSRKGGDPSEWPEDLRVRELPR